MESITSENLQE